MVDSGLTDAETDTGRGDANVSGERCNGLDDDGDGSVDEGWRLAPVRDPAILSPSTEGRGGNGDLWSSGDGFHATWWREGPAGRTILERIELDPRGVPVGGPTPYASLPAGEGPGPRTAQADDGARYLAHCRSEAPRRALARITDMGSATVPLLAGPSGAEGDLPCGLQPPSAVGFSDRVGLLWATDQARLLVWRDGAETLHTFDGTTPSEARPEAVRDATGGFVVFPLDEPGGRCLAIDRIDPEGRPLFRAGCFASPEPGTVFRNATGALADDGSTLFIAGLERAEGAVALALDPDGSVVLAPTFIPVVDWNLDLSLVNRNGRESFVLAASSCIPLCNVKLTIVHRTGTSGRSSTQDADDEGVVFEPRLLALPEGGVLMTYAAREPGGAPTPLQIRSIIYECIRS